MKPVKELVIFPGIPAEYLIEDFERILEACPEMHVSGSWSFGEVVPNGKERCGIYDFITRDVTPVKLSTVVEEVKDCIGDETYKRNWKVYLYKE